MKLVPSSPATQQTSAEAPIQQAMPLPEFQEAQPVGNPQVMLRLVKPEEADVMAKQVMRPPRSYSLITLSFILLLTTQK